MRKIILIICISTIILTGCGQKEERIKETIGVKEAKQLLENKDTVLIDVRTENEYEQHHIDGAINIPLGLIDRAHKQVPDKNKNIIVYCQSGGRSKQAQEMLSQMGYKRVYDLGSILNWQ